MDTSGFYYHGQMTEENREDYEQQLDLYKSMQNNLDREQYELEEYLNEQRKLDESSLEK